MLRRLKLQPKALTPYSRCLPHFSSSSSSSPSSEQDSAAAGDPLTPDAAAAAAAREPTYPPHPNYSSYFKDIKDRLKAPQSPPRRIPTNPPPPPSFAAAANPPPAASLEEIRKILADFRLKSGGSSSGDRPPSGPPLSYQDFIKSNVIGKPADSGAGTGKVLSFNAIRESLRKIGGSNEGQAQSSTFNIKGFQDSLKKGMGEGERPQLIGTDKLPDSIFGRERREKKGEGEQGETKALRTEFVKMYSYEELGEKLRKLRPEKDSGKGEWFSFTELNERLAKLRELEEKEMESRLGGASFRELRESLQRLKEVDSKKKANMHRFIFGNIGLSETPTFMLGPPQEHLLENYFHPDHMSSAQKLKLELKKVRDEFKMSESDCGSARVQVAQLTTKIKHLSAVLHKKDKHSRKGLHEMVQHRKKLLKYLRRTDWDSYSLVLSRLGLRDIPEYKIADYKS